MNSLLLFLLLLGSAPDQPATGTSAGPARAEAAASARILRGETIAFGHPVVQGSTRATGDGQVIFALAPIRSTALAKNADGHIIQLQEFQ